MTPRASDRGHARRGTILLALLTVSGVPLACGDQEDRSLCSVFERVVESRAVVAALDPQQATAGDAAKLAEEHQKLVEQLQQVTDGRYASAVADLNVAITDLRNTLESVDPDADYATWAPLVEDDLTAVRDASAHVESLIEPGCQPAS